MRKAIILWVIGFLLAAVGFIWASHPVHFLPLIATRSLQMVEGAPVQGGTLFNDVLTSAVNASVSKTVTAAANERAHVYGLDARCSAGTATLDIDDGAAGKWDSASGEVGTATFRANWTTGLTGTINTVMTITLSACGAGNTGTLVVQADRY